MTDPKSDRWTLLRTIVAISLLVAAFVLAAMVAALPWMSPDKPGIAFLLCIIVGFALIGRALWRPRPWAFWLIVLAAGLRAARALLHRREAELVRKVSPGR